MNQVISSPNQSIIRQPNELEQAKIQIQPAKTFRPTTNHHTNI